MKKMTVLTAIALAGCGCDRAVLVQESGCLVCRYNYDNEDSAGRRWMFSDISASVSNDTKTVVIRLVDASSARR